MRKLVLAIVFILVLMLCLGCRTKVQTVEVERTKVEYQERLKVERDSVYLHDSVFVELRGDTVYRDRWRTKYLERIRCDTISIERRDSISYPVVVEVEKPRHWFYKIGINLYRLVLLLLIIYIGWRSIRSIVWRRKL